jgi:hypothetical protein
MAAVALACAFAAAGFAVATAADAPAAAANADCVGIVLATAEGRDAVIVRVVDPDAPLGGTITAYGGDRMWTGQIERGALVDLPYGGHEASVIVRADGPIDGIAYTPTGTCTFYAGVLGRGYIDERAISRPTVVLGSAQPAPPVSCAHPFVLPAVKQAVEPHAPADASGGTVRVAVALDARGSVRFARVLSSPSVTLNASAMSAATRSEYSPAIFRCAAVPSAYPFGVEYPP